MHGSLYDQWTVWHILGGIVVGFVLYNFIPARLRFEFAVGTPIAFEIVEQNIVVSWLGIIQAETIMNSLADIIITIPSIYLGMYLARLK